MTKRRRTVVNGECPKCGAPAYVGLQTKIECTRRTCDESPGMRALTAAWRKRVKNLRARLDRLEDEEGPLVEQAKKDLRKAIEDILSVDPLA